MKMLRFFVVAAVLAYAGWLAWPWIAPLLGMAPPAGGGAMRSSAEAGAPLFGVVPPWALLAAAGEPAGLPLDPLWLALGGLLLLGALVIVASRRIRRKRLPGQFAY